MTHSSWGNSPGGPNEYPPEQSAPQHIPEQKVLYPYSPQPHVPAMSPVSQLGRRPEVPNLPPLSTKSRSIVWKLLATVIMVNVLVLVVPMVINTVTGGISPYRSVSGDVELGKSGDLDLIWPDLKGCSVDDSDPFSLEWQCRGWTMTRIDMEGAPNLAIGLRRAVRAVDPMFSLEQPVHTPTLDGPGRRAALIHVAHGQGALNGVAIASSESLEDVVVITVDSDSKELAMRKFRDLTRHLQLDISATDFEGHAAKDGKSDRLRGGRIGDLLTDNNRKPMGVQA